uniref:Uncharacterized protein n=1 Tax=Urocitellus parryii TaxID=9999 RepID=A0A8D2HZP1_UROPR
HKCPHHIPLPGLLHPVPMPSAPTQKSKTELEWKEGMESCCNLALQEVIGVLSENLKISSLSSQNQMSTRVQLQIPITLTSTIQR